MKEVEIECALCGKGRCIPEKEYNRQRRKGRIDFYCSLSCAAKRGNIPRKNSEVTRHCKHCGKPFISSTAKRGAIFCSRSCASAGSVTSLRREHARRIGHNLPHTTEQVANSLRNREGWKYIKLGAKLLSQGIRHQFEFPLDGAGIFDLVLFDLKLLVEFDGPYHRSGAQKEEDEKKNRAGEREGWKVVRIETPIGVIPSTILDSLYSISPPPPF